MPNKYPCKCYRCNLDSSRVSSCSYGCSLPHAKKKNEEKEIHRNCIICYSSGKFV